ncbi:MAG: DUF192 domain-containing protein [Lentisphaeria bacterium]|nr:DUF192 domain-containing protein [Lentisphaeria bacterium]
MLRNITRNTLLSRSPARAAGFWQRFMGLMGKKDFPEHYDCLVFEKCNSIHCFFMRMTIDVIFTDKENKVVKCISELKPWHLAFGTLRSCNCIELPSGTLKKSGTLPGDRLGINFTEKEEKYQ